MHRPGLASICFSLALLLAEAGTSPAQDEVDVPAYIRAHYTKQEHRIPMRDGVHLFTAVYSPKDTSKKYPMLLMRTPYSIPPYGADALPDHLGPNRHFPTAGYLFVYQDVRGCFMSEGKFENMRPHIDVKKGKKDVDESSDSFDTIDWLVKHVPNNNGRVGMWGISYPGFYAAAGMIDAHPALKAVSPQAPIADWFFDDFHHHGAFFLPHSFNFFASFGHPRPEPTTQWHGSFHHGTPDGYQFFLDMGPLKNADARYFKGDVSFWNQIAEHPNYDDFWKARNLLPHLRNIAPAVMTVGGWFDAEDLYGPLKIYRKVERETRNFNVLVMGPWRHGGWARTDGDRLGNIHFGGKTAAFFQKEIELPFFEGYLRDKHLAVLPEAYVFETGLNQWHRLYKWPPPEIRKKSLYLRAGGRLSFEPPGEEDLAFDEYVSDPNHPVPFTEAINTSMTAEYMTDDQRFAARRPDVLVYQTEVLKDNLTLAGPLLADLRVSTSAGDADWVVKLIDVFPGEVEDPPTIAAGQHLGGYQMMVRSEIIRGRFRHGYRRPKPFVSNEPDRVCLELQDVLHTFAKGHRIMVQVQSTWFPLVDRNPQKYVANIFQADEKDFIKANHRVYRSKQLPTRLEVGVVPALP